jgi:hypothetical protein
VWSKGPHREILKERWITKEEIPLLLNYNIIYGDAYASPKIM